MWKNISVYAEDNTEQSYIITEQSYIIIEL